MHNNGSNMVTINMPTPDWSHLNDDDRAVLDTYYASGVGSTNDADLAMVLSKFAGGYSIDEFIEDLKAEREDDEDDDNYVAGPLNPEDIQG